MSVTQDDIKKITQHSDLTDAVIANIGETLALQQALSFVPSFDGKNLDLKSFLQDVETGEQYCPEGIRPRYYAGVVAKLRDLARDAVSGKVITESKDLKNALKEHFAPRKNYTHYTAEIQGIRMRQNESITEYHGRIKRLMDSAKASLKENFTPEQVITMAEMLGGIAVESFKRGLSDEMLYALSVQEPKSLDDAVKIARRIERDMTGSRDRKGHISLMEEGSNSAIENPRKVHFEPLKPNNLPWNIQNRSENQVQQFARWNSANNENPQNSNFKPSERRYRDPSPYKNQEGFKPRDNSPFRGRSDFKPRDPSSYRSYNNDFRPRDPSPYRNYDSNSRPRDASPYRNSEDLRQPIRSSERDRSSFRGRSPTDLRHAMQQPYYMTPPNPPIPYPYLPTYPVMPPFPYPYSNPHYPNISRPNEQKIDSTHLNSRSAHPTDAAMSDNNKQRQTNVKFITAEDLSNQTQTENQHP